MSDKIEKLDKATNEAKKLMDGAKTAFDDSLVRLNAAKEALREMDEEDQKRIQINDTKLPDLIDLHSRATEEYSEAKSRYETNVKYLDLLKAKLGQT
jgi:DNA repair exonuclease SbcCD ATPase subunit